MKHKMMKTIMSGAFAAVLAVGFMGTGSASAASAQPNHTQMNSSDLQSYLENWLKDNGYGDLLKQIESQLPAGGQVTNPQPSKPQTSKPSNPQTSKPSKPETSQPTQPTKPDTSAPSNDNNSSSNNSDQSGYAAQVIKLVNQERAKAGLKSLTENAKLSGMALDKAKDMNNNHYFDHTSPTYGSPFDMMKKYGISFSYAGENIAMGQKTPADVMNAWMNSQGHRENILNSNYTTIGVAYYNGYWVQEFIAN